MGRGLGAMAKGTGAGSGGSRRRAASPCSHPSATAPHSEPSAGGNGEIGCLWQRCFSRVALEQKDLFHQEKKQQTKALILPCERF